MDTADDALGVPETPGAEAPPAWTPDWSLHARSVANWASLSPADHEATGTPVQGLVEQTDAMVRRHFAYHDLDTVLAADPTAAFVAFTVAEAYYYVLSRMLRAFQVNGALSDEDYASLHLAVMARLKGSSERIAWHAAGHLGAARPEPFGPAVPIDALAHLEFTPGAPSDG